MSKAGANPGASLAARRDKPARGFVEFLDLLRKGNPGATSYILLLGLRPIDTVRLLRLIEEGLPFKALAQLRRNLNLPIARVADLLRIAPRTLARRRREGRLRPAESDRLLRTARLLAGAIELFDGDAGAARTWLSSPQTALGGAVPIELARTEVGSREVERLIGRLEHGVYS